VQQRARLERFDDSDGFARTGIHGQRTISSRRCARLPRLLHDPRKPDWFEKLGKPVRSLGVGRGH
jgi:hypothetical protein